MYRRLRLEREEFQTPQTEFCWPEYALSLISRILCEAGSSLGYTRQQSGLVLYPYGAMDAKYENADLVDGRRPPFARHMKPAFLPFSRTYKNNTGTLVSQEAVIWGGRRSHAYVT